MNRKKKKFFLVTIIVCMTILVGYWYRPDPTLNQNTSSPTRQHAGPNLHETMTTPTRQDVLHKYCDAHTKCRENRTCQFKRTDSMIVHDKYNVMWCDVAKVGSTTMKWEISRLSGKNVIRHGDIHMPHILRRYGLKYLSDYNAMERQYRLDNYYKFMFVRHPLVRVIGAYIDKFEHKPFPYKKKLIEFHLKSIRHDKKMLRERQLQFKEYLWLITKTSMRNDVHWVSYADNCLPCHIQYDFIGKLETFKADFNYIMKEIFHVTEESDDHSSFGREHSINATLEKCQHYISILNQSEKQALYARVYRDTKMFGYNLENVPVNKKT